MFLRALQEKAKKSNSYSQQQQEKKTKKNTHKRDFLEI